MVGTVFLILGVSSVLFGALTGNMDAVSRAALDGAGKTVELTLTLWGLMGLWGGVMRVMEEKGWIAVLARVLRPMIGWIFPTAGRDPQAAQSITACMAANFLGIGNAATPLAVTAMERMKALLPEGEERPGADMITFTVMNTAPINFLPTTVIGILHSAGTGDPFAILLPVWICSAAGWCMAILVCKICGAVFVRKRKSRAEASCGGGAAENARNC